MPLFQGCWQLDNFYNPVDVQRKGLTDCYFFFYSTCKNGNSCQYRHELSALGHEVMCSRWLEGRCEDIHCKERHMLIGKRRDRTPCFWEHTPIGCRKAHCVFKHSSNKCEDSDQEPCREDMRHSFISKKDSIENKRGKFRDRKGKLNEICEEEPESLVPENHEKTSIETEIIRTEPNREDINKGHQYELNDCSIPQPTKVPFIKIIDADENIIWNNDEETLEASSGIESLNDTSISLVNTSLTSIKDNSSIA